MTSLASNGRIGNGAAHTGTDKNAITYPAVSTCITLTAICTAGLAGIHLFRGNSNAITVGDLEAWGELAAGTTAVYLVGMITGGQWTGGARNLTGLTYTGVNGGTLVAEVRRVLGNFAGTVYVNDTTALAGEVDLQAARNRDVLTVLWTGGGGVGMIASANCTALN